MAGGARTGRQHVVDRCIGISVGQTAGERHVMRVLYVVNSLTRDSLVGPGDSCHHTFMQNAFRRLGWKVRQYPGSVNGERTRDLHRFGRCGYRAMQCAVPSAISSSLRVAYSLWHDERSRLDLQRVISEDRPALLFEKHSAFQTGCARAAAAHAIPHVVQFHAPAEESPHYHASRRSAALLKTRMAAAGTMATAVVVVSQYMSDYLVRLGVPSEKILVLPNGVDLELIAKSRNGASVRQELGISSDALVVGFVGTMRPWQGYRILPEVFAAVRARVRNAVFLLVGPFPNNQEKEQFETQLVQCGVRRDFLLTGAVPAGDVPACIKAMDICVMPDSTDYCSPMKLFEYGACARAVVMPRRSPILDVIRDGENGLLFDPSKPTELAEQIIYLADKPQLRDALGTCLCQEVRSKHTYARNVEQILEYVGLPTYTEASDPHAAPDLTSSIVR